MPELQRLGCTVRQVDDPAGHDRSAVVDPDYHGLAVSQIRDLHIASHGKREVRGGHVIHLVRFAACGRLALKILPVPGRRPNLIRFRLSLLADFGFRLNGTNWSRCRLRDVRSLSRSQADDQKCNRQSMSYTSSHSVLLAYSKVPLAVRLVSLQFVDAIGLPNWCQCDLGGTAMT